MAPRVARWPGLRPSTLSPALDAVYPRRQAYGAFVSTRSACVIADSTPEQLAAYATNHTVEIRANRIGTLLTGRPGALVIDLAHAFPGPVYDVMWNPTTNWFAVTIFRGVDAVRWDNRPGTDCGYQRADDVLGATSPRKILEALDIPADAIGYAEA